MKVLIIRKEKLFFLIILLCALFLITLQLKSMARPGLKGNVKIYAVGDLMLGRFLAEDIEKNNRSYLYPFAKVRNIFDKNSVIFANLECAITPREHHLDSSAKYVFKNNPAALAGIKYCGFNLLSIANNHILDYYEAGLTDTMQVLKSNRIYYSGAGRNLAEARQAAIIQKNKIRIGLLSYTDLAQVIYRGNPPLKFTAGPNKAGVNPRPPVFNDEIKTDIEAAKKKVDLLMVALHWGIEESFTVLNSQREFARQLIDHGVDVVLGTHPHQFQGIEIYRGKPIFYSLGNFIFDQEDPENKESFIMVLFFRNKQLIEMIGVPVRIINYQIIPVPGWEAKDLLEREVRLCKPFNSGCYIKNGLLHFELPGTRSTSAWSWVSKLIN